MAEQTGKFLTELPELTTPIEDDLMYIVDDDTSKRITLKNLKSVVGGEDVTGTASGAVATFIDGGDDKPMKSLVVDVEATQSGSGTPSPSNVRPIVGRSEVNVSVSGKNLCPKALNGSKQDLTFTVNDNGEVAVSGTATGSSYYNIATVKLKANQTYTISGCPSGGSQGIFGLAFYNSDNTTVIATDFGSGATYTPTADETVNVNIRYWYGQAVNATFKPQLEIGSEATAYEPYNGSITTIPLDRTVYGGTLDVTRGVLTVTDEVVDLGSLTWGYGTSSGVTFFRTNRVTNIKPTPIGSVAKAMCSIFPIITTAGIINVPDMSLMVWTNGEVYIRDSDYTDVPSFKTAMSGQQLVYELATPQTYTLTPEEVSTILGYNNISADSGEVSVVYVRDLNITINDLINRVTALENE